MVVQTKVCRSQARGALPASPTPWSRPTTSHARRPGILLVQRSKAAHPEVSSPDTKNPTAKRQGPPAFARKPRGTSVESPPGNPEPAGKTGLSRFVDRALDCDLELPALLAAAPSRMLTSWPHRRAQHRFLKRASTISIGRKTASAARGAGCSAALERAGAVRTPRRPRHRGQAPVQGAAARYVARLGYDARDG
jgi:hypothetical protein